jgi:uncharacterized protein (DUF4213/DUF364 family)
MAIIDEILAGLDFNVKLRSVLVGAHWTVVCSRGCGMAATFMDDTPHGHVRVRDVGILHTKTCRELAEYARSDILLESSIGLAAINSLLEVDESRTVEINAADVLTENGRGKKVAVVGHFSFITRLQGVVKELFVLEQHPLEGEYPAEAAEQVIPRAELVAITSSTLINHTLDGLLNLVQPGTPVMLLGPSTPLSTVLFSHGVNLLCGAKVVDEESVLRTVSQGAAFPQVEGVKLVTFGIEAWISRLRRLG